MPAPCQELDTFLIKRSISSAWFGARARDHSSDNFRRPSPRSPALGRQPFETSPVSATIETRQSSRKLVKNRPVFRFPILETFSIHRRDSACRSTMGTCVMISWKVGALLPLMAANCRPRSSILDYFRITVEALSLEDRRFFFGSVNLWSCEWDWKRARFDRYFNKRVF